MFIQTNQHIQVIDIGMANPYSGRIPTQGHACGRLFPPPSRATTMRGPNPLGWTMVLAAPVVVRVRAHGRVKFEWGV